LNYARRRLRLYVILRTCQPCHLSNAHGCAYSAEQFCVQLLFSILSIFSETNLTTPLYKSAQCC